MESHAPRSSGLLGSLRSFADGILASAQDRIQLLAIELQEEKFRLIQIVLWVSALVLLALLAVVFASLALVVVFWEARVAVVLSLAASYLVGFIGVALAFRSYLKRQPRPFAATIGELQGDRACIRTES
jgi:uncharacterized membrane protein YqjE